MNWLFVALRLNAVVVACGHTDASHTAAQAKLCNDQTLVFDPSVAVQ